MIYLDSSALLKLLVEEAESPALARWLGRRRSTPLVTSELARVEVVRAARRLDPATVAAARGLVRQLDLVPLTGGVVDSAADLAPSLLRSLDALHLASALSLGTDLSAFVAYDRRMLDSARDAGLTVAHPGAA